MTMAILTVRGQQLQGYIPSIRKLLEGTTALLEGLWPSISRNYPRTSSGPHTTLPAHHQAPCLKRKEMHLTLEEKRLPTFQRQPFQLRGTLWPLDYLKQHRYGYHSGIEHAVMM